MRPNIAREGALCLWFALNGAAFWGTYAGLPLAAPLTALYGLFLVAAVALLALRLLRSDGGDAVGTQQAGRGARKKNDLRG